MALYRCEAKIIGREKRGHSVVAASAYRTGQKLRDEKAGRTHDYSRRNKGIVSTTLLCPEGSPGWAREPAMLWNMVEAGEKRSDAQLAREFILAVPPELSSEQQFQLAVGWAQQKLVGSGMVAEVALHHPKSRTNPHVHVLCTMRKLDGEKFNAKKATEWNDVALLVEWRKSWADAVNAALEKAGRTERVDHRSLKDQGIDRIPEPKIGVAAAAMKRKGTAPDPERFQLVRWVKTLNEVMPQKRAIETKGEVPQMGVGKTWWERSIVFMNRVKQAARETVMDTWRMLLASRGAGHDNTPAPQKGPDISR